MSSENKNDFYNLTFAQREGKAPLPEPMRLEQIPHQFRNEILLSVNTEIDDAIYTDSFAAFEYFEYELNIGSILDSYEMDILKKFYDDITGYQDKPRRCRSYFSEIIKQGEYYEVLTLVEFMLRHDACSENLYNGLIDAFRKTPVAYFAGEIGGVPTIMPRISLESGEATRQAIEAIQQTGLGGASTHLRQAAEHINAQQYTDAIADSISAVESVARQIAPESKTLGQALNVLERKGVITNQQLKAGFEKLYAYTNSEEGIRHALLNKNSSDVGLDEATFMFGACASFAAYLLNKQRQVEQQVTK